MHETNFLENVEFAGVCLWHLLKAIQENCGKFSSQEICNQFKADIQQIADATVNRLPDVLLEKLLDKYTDTETVAMQWFLKEWGGDVHNFSFPMPCGLRANSLAEDANGQFKRECTNRKRKFAGYPRNNPLAKPAHHSSPECHSWRAVSTPVRPS